MATAAEKTYAAQAKFMYRAGALSTEENLDQFEAMHESERRQVVRTIALGEIRENATIPLRDEMLERMTSQEAMDFAESLRPEPAANEMEALRESGVPMVEAAKPADDVLMHLGHGYRPAIPTARSSKSCSASRTCRRIRSTRSKPSRASTVPSWPRTTTATRSARAWPRFAKPVSR